MGTGRRADGTNPRALGTNPRALGTNPGKRYRPTAAELKALDAAWDAFLDDADRWEELALAVGAVLGRRKSAARIVLENAKPVRITDIPLTDQEFRVDV